MHVGRVQGSACATPEQISRYRYCCPSLSMTDTLIDIIKMIHMTSTLSIASLTGGESHLLVTEGVLSRVDIVVNKERESPNRKVSIMKLTLTLLRKVSCVRQKVGRSLKDEWRAKK